MSDAVLRLTALSLHKAVARPLLMPRITRDEAGGVRMNWRALILATLSFAVSFAAWGLIGGLAPVFTDLYHCRRRRRRCWSRCPVLLGSLARLPMGMLTDRFGGRAMFTAAAGVSAAAAWLVPLTTSYAVAAGVGVLHRAGRSSFADRRGVRVAVDAAGEAGHRARHFRPRHCSASRWRSSAAPSRRRAFGWQSVFRGVGVMLLAWAVVFALLARNAPTRRGRPASARWCACCATSRSPGGSARSTS